MFKKYFLFLIFLCGISSLAFSQIISEDQEIQRSGNALNLTSPYHTTLSFFYNLEDNNFEPKKAAQTLNLKGVDPEMGEKLSIKLLQIFEGKGVLIRTSTIPDDQNYQDSIFGNDEIYYFDRQKLPGIFLEKTGKRWKFSSFSVSKIEEIHHETYPYGTAKLLNLLPKIGTDEYLGLQLWQLVGLVFLLFFTFLAHWIFTFVADKVLLYFFKRFGYAHAGENYILPVARVTSIYLIVLLLALFIRVLQLPTEVWSWILVLLNTLKPFLITVIFYKLVDVVAAYFHKLASKTESTLDDQLVPLLRKSLKAFVILVGTLFILRDGLNLDIIPFLTGLSIGGLAIALAAQDTIKNFFGSVMIFIDRPFQVGDWITSGEIDGTVEEVGFRSSRIRTFRNSLMYVPNGKIADSILDNHGLRKFRRFYTTLTITYSTSPELIEKFVKGLQEIVLAHPKTRKDVFNIYFNNLSAYSQDIMFYIFFEVPTWPEELAARHEILLQIVKLANSLGVKFAFPTQTLHFENNPTNKSDHPNYQHHLTQFVQEELRKKGDFAG